MRFLSIRRIIAVSRWRPCKYCSVMSFIPPFTSLAHQMAPQRKLNELGLSLRFADDQRERKKERETERETERERERERESEREREKERVRERESERERNDR